MMNWLRRLVCPAQAAAPYVSDNTNEWLPPADAGIGDAPPAIRKPFNIRRIALQRPTTVGQGDEFTVKIINTDERGRSEEERLPTFPIKRQMTIDSVTRFEVIDEFGVDVGLGFLLGQAKK